MHTHTHTTTTHSHTQQKKSEIRDPCSFLGVTEKFVKKKKREMETRPRSHPLDSNIRDETSNHCTDVRGYLES